jgi:hypothetical protein
MNPIRTATWIFLAVIAAAAASVIAWALDAPTTPYQPNAGIFAVKPGSPALGAGAATACAFVGNDYELNARPSTKCTIGVMEK